MSLGPKPSAQTQQRITWDVRSGCMSIGVEEVWGCVRLVDVRASDFHNQLDVGDSRAAAMGFPSLPQSPT